MTRASLYYAGTSALCLVLHNILMIVAVGMGWPLIVAVLNAFIVVAAVGYGLHSRLTFAEPLSVVRFVRYCLAMSVNIPLAFVLTWFWRNGAGLPITLASPVATVCMVAVNFILSRWAIVAPARQVIRS